MLRVPIIHARSRRLQP